VSTFRDPPRILDASESIPDLVRVGLEAERFDPGPEARHIERLVERWSPPSGVTTKSRPVPSRSWPRLATIAGIGLIAGAGLVAKSWSERTSPPAGKASAPPVAALPTGPEEERADDLPTFRPDELPTAAPNIVQPAPRVVPRSGSGARSAAARPAATEAAEIDLLARAHEALRSRPADTPGLCQKHQVEFADGRFIQEREALAIEALLYLHRRDEAQRRWNDFQQRYPASNHRTHLAALFSPPSH
jgi:hypothetical protein